METDLDKASAVVDTKEHVASYNPVVTRCSLDVLTLKAVLKTLKKNVF